jgi:hypothetical protein
VPLSGQSFFIVVGQHSLQSANAMLANPCDVQVFSQAVRLPILVLLPFMLRQVSAKAGNRYPVTSVF